MIPVIIYAFQAALKNSILETNESDLPAFITDMCKKLSFLCWDISLRLVIIDNSLSNDIVNSDSVFAFKRKIKDVYFLGRGSIHCE